MTPTLILAPDELRALTGTSQPKRQAAWLTLRGWVFEPATRRGECPKVDRAYYLARMSGQAVSSVRREGPRFGMMMGAR